MSRQNERNKARRAAGWKTVEIWLSPEMQARFDKARGGASRAEILTELLEQFVSVAEKGPK